MTDDTDQRLPEPADDVVFSRVSEGAVLLSTESEVYYGLNETGARTWEILQRTRTMNALCRQLEEEYAEVDPATLRTDVLELLESLAEHGLVRPADGGDGGGDVRSGAGE